MSLNKRDKIGKRPLYKYTPVWNGVLFYLIPNTDLQRYDALNQKSHGMICYRHSANGYFLSFLNLIEFIHNHL